jgi:hypothetical protein
LAFYTERGKSEVKAEEQKQRMRCAMKSLRYSLSLLLVVSLSYCLLNAQSQAPSQTVMAAVPRLVNFSGRAADAQGKAIFGIAGVTFAIYKEQYEGAPLWMETQNAQADAKGNYTVQLGATKPEGLPLELFSSGEARWLGVRVNGGEEQARVLLLSVPYALKAADAETVGGLPASAFVLAAPLVGTTNAVTPTAPTASPQQPLTGTTPVTTAGGTVNKLAKFDAAADITNSQIFDNGTSVGIGNTAPGAKLDVTGTGIFRGALTLPATGAANSTTGKNSQPFNLAASSFNSSTKAAVNQTFRWQSEPTGNNTATPLGKLNLLFGSGTAAPSETGLSISNKGAITFASGQTFPSSVGTVKSVGLSAPSSDFAVSGSPVTTSGTLGLNWNVAPTSVNTANAIVKRDGTGSFNAGSISASGVNAVYGASTDASGNGVWGNNPNHTGVYGNGFYGVWGNATYIGVYGASSSSQASGVYGYDSDPGGSGVIGVSDGIGVNAGSSNGQALVAENGSTLDTFVSINHAGGAPLYVAGTGGSVFIDGGGNLSATGTISGAVKNFRIDHPLDPANKYLNHTSIESSEMLNLYTGNAVLDADGSAAVELPAWFTALNQDFRYQLTPVGAFAPLYIAKKLMNNRFLIAGGLPGMEVSWQITGVRHDAYANAHPLTVEAEKQGEERGRYLHPELYGATREQSVGWNRSQRPHARSVSKGTKQLTPP